MATQVLVPILGEAIGEARILAWLKQPGDPVQRGDELAELETDKAVLMLESPAQGTLLEVLIPAGAMVSTGDLLARVGRLDELADPVAPVALVTAPEAPAPVSRSEVPSATPPAAPSAAPFADQTRQRISPAARRMARQLGIDPAKLAPAAPGRRITTQDIRGQLPQAMPDRTIPQRRIATNSTQRAMAARMLVSAHEVPQFNVSMEIDVTRLLRVRAQAPQQTASVSLTGWLAYLVSGVLLRHPLLNARYDGDGLILYETVNLGIAVAAPQGLVVPVLHGAERLDLQTLGIRLNELAQSARGGRLSMAQLSDGTFTISNLGMFGVSQFTPLVNPPQAAILGIGAARPVIMLTKTGLQQMQQMTFTITVDHRVADGAAAAQFLSDLRQVIENVQSDLP